MRRPFSTAQIEEKFDLGYHTKHVDTIFARVFAEALMPQAAKCLEIQQFNFPSAAFVRKVIVFWPVSCYPLRCNQDDQTAADRGDATCAPRPLLAAFVLMAVPGLLPTLNAAGASHEVTMSCADGATWDAETQTCVTTATA